MLSSHRQAYLRKTGGLFLRKDSAMLRKAQFLPIWFEEPFLSRTKARDYVGRLGSQNHFPMGHQFYIDRPFWQIESLHFQVLLEGLHLVPQN